MLGSTWSEAFQRGGQDGKEAFTIIQLYISASFGKWAFLNRAYSAGKRLDTTLIAPGRECRRRHVGLPKRRRPQGMRSGAMGEPTG